MNRQNFKAAALGLIALAATGAIAACSNSDAPSPNASSQAAPEPAGGNVEQMIASWPEASRMAATDMIQKYGQPQEVTASTLLWRDNGPWKWTRLFRDPVPHSFPMQHPDVLEQAIDYSAPVDMFDDLARFDGSVIVERTKGQMSARCDKEGANFLAINLANDVATGKRTVEEARTYYAAAIKRFMSSKEMDPYMQKLQFQTPKQAAGDPDRAVL